MSKSFLFATLLSIIFLADAQAQYAISLSTTKFRNGDTILITNSDKEWFRAARKGEPAMRYLKANKGPNAHIYVVYNWYAVIDTRGLAPEGWHIPVCSETCDTNGSLRMAIKYDSTIVFEHYYEHPVTRGLYRYNKCWLLQPPKPLGSAATITILDGGKFLVLAATSDNEENTVLCVKDQ